MKKIKMSKGPMVKMKDDSYKNCEIRLVYQWTNVNKDGDTKEMGIIVIQPEEPKDSHPFASAVKLSEIDFITFR